MTAIVAVLNKHGVAIAADSAVTMGDTHKVVNSGNKIITLSKYQPMAVMTYGVTSFMGTPWDLIIKLYRKQLGRTKFEHTIDYANDFLKFLHDKQFFSKEERNKRKLINRLEIYLGLCKKNIWGKDSVNKAVSSDEDKQKFLKEIQLNIEANQKPIDVYIEVDKVSFEDFTEYAGQEIEDYLSNNYSSFSREEKDAITKSFYYYQKLPLDSSDVSGLVFCGYGDKDIYPSTYLIEVTSAFNGHLKYIWREFTNIEDGKTDVAIVPYAQIDVSQTIIRGIKPSFMDLIKNEFTTTITAIMKSLVTVLGNDEASILLKKQIEGVNYNVFSSLYLESLKRLMRKDYTDDLLQTVINLDKEDMANLAESLISLTSLVRRMSPHEETVGGPVDVAFISKGDGFVWLKRKLYFNPKLNRPFFDNYYNE